MDTRSTMPSPTANPRNALAPRWRLTLLAVVALGLTSSCTTQRRVAQTPAVVPARAAPAPAASMDDPATRQAYWLADFRAVLAPVLQSTFGLTAVYLAQLFPGFALQQSLQGLMRA